METLSNLLGRAGYLPHGYCFSWNPTLLWTMVTADLAIAMAYYSIPAALLTLVKKRPDFGFNWVAVLFSLFIFACGTTHLLEVWSIWNPDYALVAGVKAITAVVSVATAIVLWPLLPRALAMPSVQALQESVAQYEREAEQRAQAEAGLNQARGELRVALARMGAAFVSTDSSGRILQMNEAAQQLTGWNEAEASGVNVLQVLRYDAGEATSPDKGIVGLIDEKSIPLDTVLSVTIHRKDGGHQPLLMTFYAIRDDAGSQVGTVAIFTDRSEKLRSQAEMVRLTRLVEASSDAIIGTTPEGVVTEWSKGAERMLGVPAESAIGQPYESLVPPRVDAVPKSVASPAGTIERSAESPDGNLLVLSEVASPVEDGQGQVVAVSHVLRDVTASRRAENLRVAEVELRAENRRMAEAAQLKNQFLANMSHELRTPLNSIIGFSQLLAEEGEAIPQAQRAEFLGFIHSSGQHLLRLINDVLDLSKVESGTFEYYPEPVDMRQLVSDAVAVVKPQAAAQSVKVEVEIGVDLTDVEADPARLKQIVFNYLSNAIKFSHVGGVVKVRIAAEGDEAFRVEVEDQGIGIPEDSLHRLFVEFQQLDSGSTKRHSGTGLGLALTRKLVAAQGGTTGVRSKVGVGSVFHAVLPRKGRLIVQAPAPLPQDQPAGEAPPRLLVIDDDLDLRQLVASHGMQAGFAVTSHGESEGIVQASTQAFDAVSMSALVRSHIGVEVLESLRSRTQVSPVTVVVAPTRPPVGFRVHEILTKPFEESLLRAALVRTGVLELPAARVLVVDDDLQALSTMRVTLGRYATIQATLVESSAEALSHIRAGSVDALILDLMLPEMDGFVLLELLRSSPDLRSIPVLVWTGHSLSAAERNRLVGRELVTLREAGVEPQNLLHVFQDAARLIAKGRVSGT